MKIKDYIGKKLTTDEFAQAQNYRYKKIDELEEMKFESGDDYLLLKWGGLKGYDYSKNLKAQELIKELYDIGINASTITQRNTDRQKEILCEIIDITDGYIQNDWEGDFYTKQQAKDYIMNYGN